MQKLKIVILVCISAMLGACAQLPSDTSSLPELFQNSIATTLPGGLRLVKIEFRCADCPPWRIIEYNSNTSKQPLKQVKVTVEEGYSAMYAYPSTDYFANTKIEQSSPGSYESDKATIMDSLEHEYHRRSERVNDYLSDKPDLIAQMEPLKAAGKDYLEFEKSNYSGVEYIALNENVIGLTSYTISQIHIFDDKREITVTAYLLDKKKAKFTTIDEFIALKKDFIEGYINFLNSTRTRGTESSL